MSENEQNLLSKAYEPKNVEDSIYAKWEEHKCFHGHEDSKKQKYSIVIPHHN